MSPHLYDGCAEPDAREPSSHNHECRQIANRVRQGDRIKHPLQPGVRIEKSLVDDDTASQSWDFRQGFLNL